MIKTLDGEKYPRTSSIKDNVVTIKHVTALKDGKHYMVSHIDMSNMDGDEVMKHAAMNVLIQILRPRAFKPFKSNEIDETKVYDPTDYPAQRGGGIDKHEAAIRVLESLGFNRDQAELALRTPKEKVKELLAEFATQPDEPIEPEWVENDESSNEDDEQ